MYFGSVNFFKQLIYSTVICSSVSAAAFSVIFGIKCAADDTDKNDRSELPSPVKQVSASADGSDSEGTASTRTPSEETSVTSGIVIPENAPIEEVYSALTENGYSSDEIISYISGISGSDGNSSQTMPSADESTAAEAVTSVPDSGQNEASVSDTAVPTNMQEQPSIVTADTAQTAGSVPQSESTPTGTIMNENIRSDAPAYDSDISDFPELYTGVSAKYQSGSDLCLLFSDSPSDCTNDLLTILSSQQVNAVFLADAGTDGFSSKLLNKITSEDHLVGIELEKSYTDVYECLSDINTTFESISADTGIKPNVISCKTELPDNITSELESRGFTVLTPAIYGDDVPDPDWSSVYNNTVELTESGRNGSVISLKGGSGDLVTLFTAEDIISRLKSDGYGFAVPDRT